MNIREYKIMKNKNMVSVQKKITEYKAVIFDVDGTLYSQPRLRLYMLRRLLTYYICHPTKLKELMILKIYRSSRERWQTIAPELQETIDQDTTLENAQYAYVAKRTNTSVSYVKQLVLYWLHTSPLSYLAKCKDSALIDIIALLQDHSITVAIYSDYPSVDKLKALNIHPDYNFSSSDEEINCMKPSEEAMKTILSALHTEPDSTLMIGDRFSKDGIAAKNMGMDFVILSKSIPKRSSVYHLLLND